VTPLKEASTKRYYVTSQEIEEKLHLEGAIETIHKVTPYEHDQDVELKDIDFIITTVIDIENTELDKPKVDWKLSGPNTR